MMAIIVKEVPSHLTNQPTLLGPSAELAYSVLMLQPRGRQYWTSDWHGRGAKQAVKSASDGIATKIGV
jgi:hypothetical protein